MLLPSIAIILGFLVLAWGADRLVVGAVGTARHLGMSPLFMGLTVVGLGTSAPEMIVSAIAAWNGNPGLAVGNALGSNITNSALVLGAAALVAPLQVGQFALRREFPVLLAIMALALVLILDGTLGRWDGALLVLGVIPLLWWMVRIGRDDGTGIPAAAETIAEVPVLSLKAAVAWLLVGIVILLVSSRIVVWGAVEFTMIFGVDDTVVGLSVVALGTSLPELGASIAGALKNEHEIAVGNVLGSNMFNLLVVLGLPGLIAPGPVHAAVLTRDFPVMVGVTVAVMAVAALRRGPPMVTRGPGAFLVLGFVAYMLLLYDKLP
jgi:cation:H+ antiporter